MTHARPGCSRAGEREGGNGVLDGRLGLSLASVHSTLQRWARGTLDRLAKMDRTRPPPRAEVTSVREEEEGRWQDQLMREAKRWTVRVSASFV